MKKVVLVDDYLDFLKMQKIFIEHNNDAECITFSNPLEALKFILENDDIDIVITDFQMPSMHGFDLAKKVLEKRGDLRIIISSGHDVSTLEMLRKKHNLDDKVEVIRKDNLSFLKKLF